VSEADRTNDSTSAMLDVLRGLVSEHPVLAQLVAELAPYAPALARMAKEQIEDLVETIQRKDFYAADLMLARQMTEAEMKTLTDEARTRIVDLLARTAADTALLKEIALRAVIALVTVGIGAL
jgi:hypothetical protein